MKRTVVLVEDDTGLREKFTRSLDASDDFELLASVGTVAEARTAIDAVTPDLVLTDLGLPDGTGHEVIRYAIAIRADCLVLVVSAFGDELNVVSSIESGAIGYVLKDDTGEAFLNAIRDVAAGGAPISAAIARHVLSRLRQAKTSELSNSSPVLVKAVADIAVDSAQAQKAGLTDRELEVLSLTAKGYNFPEIGRLLGVSTETIKTHIKRVYQKLTVHTKNEAVFEAQRLGLIQPPKRSDD
jgi:DNA-binding NarL/FixJ family response regulator